MSGSSGYDAFISYSQAVSGKLAAQLQRWLERFATPWYRPRSLRIFRDYTNLPVSEDLWQTIRQSLAASSHFILLASPEAADSKWVNREVAWWRENRTAEKLYIVLTSGHLRWSDEHDDWEAGFTTCLPPAARGMFSHEPLWVDLSSVQTTAALDRSNPVLLNSVAQIAAPLRGMDKDSLVGEHITYYRRARRQRGGGVIALAILTVAAVVLAFAARIQADNATSQARIATSRALVAAAVGDISSNLDLAQLLAVEAYELHADADSRSALFQVVTANPALVRYLNANSSVSALTGSGNGQDIVAGTQAGQVLCWSTRTFKKRVIARIESNITSVSASYDGDTISAANGAEAIAWTASTGTRTISIPRGQTTDLTAVSPSGRYVLVYSHRSQTPSFYSVPGTLTLLDLQTSRVVRADVTQPWTAVTMPSDHQVVLLSSALGYWERLTAPALVLTSSTRIGFGIHVYASALSPNGALVTYSNGGSTIPFWPTKPNVINPELQAASAGPIPNVIAISPDGREAVTADSGSLYVASIDKTNTGSMAATQLAGSQTINNGSLAFVGDSQHLVSASDSLVAFWNVSQLSRISTQADTRVPLTCAECSGPSLSVSPDNKNVIMSYDGSVTVQQLVPPFGEQGLTTSYSGPAAWRADGQQFFLPTLGLIEIRGLSARLPVLSRWPVTTPTGFVKAISTYQEGKYLVIVDSTDLIEIVKTSTGRVMKRFRGPGGPNADSLGPNEGTASVEGDGTTVALVTPSRGVDLIDLQTGKISTLNVSNVAAVSFGGHYLTISFIDGNVDLWNLDEKKLTHESGSNVASISINASGTTLAEYSVTDSVLLQQPGTGEIIGSFKVASPYLNQPTSMAFARDGSTLFIAVEGTGGDFTGKLERWDLSERDWIRIACQTAGAGMTPGEWRAVVGTQAPSKLACDGS